MLFNEQSTYAILNWLLGIVRAGLAAAADERAVYGHRSWRTVGVNQAARPLAFGDETAQSLGLPLAWTRIAIVAATSLTTAAAVAAGGTIGFVGLIAPHAARLLVGANRARLIPASALLGALLLLLADDVARTMAPLELPDGVLTVTLGGPFFLYLLKTHQHILGAWR